MKLNGWVATSAIICVIVLQVWFIHRSTEHRLDADATRARVASLESELAHLDARTRGTEREARVRAAEQEVRARLAMAAAFQNQAPPAESKPTSAVEEIKEETSPPPVPLEERLEQAFTTEANDPAWAEPTANRVVDSFSARVPRGSSIRDVDCRGSLCRMEIVHRTSEGHAALLQAITQPPLLWEGPGSISLKTDASGEQVTLIFLGRTGSDLGETSVWH